jgi:N-acetylneuraminic acid mutarotase
MKRCIPNFESLSSHDPKLVCVRFRIAILAAFVLTHFAAAAASAPGSWTQGTDMPMAVGASPAACEVDGILYVIGGAERATFNALQTVYAYNPVTDTWSEKKPMPTPRRFLAAAAVDGIIYVVGGFTGPFSSQSPVGPVDAYDPKTDTWSRKAAIPTPRGCLAACALDGLVYAIGGGASWPQRLRTVEAYDPTGNQWLTNKASLPEGAVFPTASTVLGRIYTFMGTKTFSYDPTINHWTTNSQYSPWSYAHMSATVEGIIYLFGGMTEDLAGAYDFALAYDPGQDRFTPKRKMPRTRLTAGCAAVNGKIYLAGGADKEPVRNPNAIYYKTLDVFDPSGGAFPHIVTGTLESSDSLRLVWEAEAGIRYGVESCTDVAGTWTRMPLPTGSTVLATNSTAETTCNPQGAAKRFFRVFEAY